ncbi:Adenosylhomocysteinase [Heracleum sosnowskyi]|uniref:Adenosylhomocysteinase n=1 Tax=Heracleum sosnowskyi TaxID=360622 RepID=A0AAD8I8F4_9APIA|nr:Adenosylhomocysteinase [Heracleum sosnowskyi]
MVSSGEKSPPKSMPGSLPSHSSFLSRVFSVETSGSQTKAKDFINADLGRLKLNKADVDLPGLIKCRAKFSPYQPLKHLKIAASLNGTTPNVDLMETLAACGAQVGWSSIDDDAVAAITRDSGVVFSLEGQTLKDKWSSKARVLDFGTSGGPHLIFDDFGDFIQLIDEGVKAEQVFAIGGILPDPASTDDEAFKAMLAVIGEGLKSDPKKYHKIKDGIVGATIGTPTGANRLMQMQRSGTLLCPVIVIDSNKFANYLTGGCQSLPDDLMNATNVRIAGKVAVVAGYGDIGRSCAAALKQARARVVVVEMDPVWALQANMDGIQVQLMKDAVSEADIFVTTTDYKDMITVEDMRKMNNNAIICNIGSFVSQTDMIGLQTLPGVKKITINPITDKFVFSETGRAIIVLAEGLPMKLSCATAPPSFALSTSLTNQVFALLELWNERSSGKYEKKVYDFPKHLDEEVAALHPEKLGANPTLLSEDQADHICIPVEGDHQPANNKHGVDWWVKICGAVASCLSFLLAVARFVLRLCGDGN